MDYDKPIEVEDSVYSKYSDEKLIQFAKIRNIMSAKSREELIYKITEYDKVNSGKFDKSKIDPSFSFNIDFKLVSNDTSPEAYQSFREEQDNDDIITPEILEKLLDKEDFLISMTTSLGKLYQSKMAKYISIDAHIQKSIKEDEAVIAKLKDVTPEMLKEQFGMLSTNKTMVSRLSHIGDELRKRYNGLTTTKVKEDILKALNDPDFGIKSLSGKARKFMRDSLCRTIYILSKGHQTFLGTFNNMIFMGSAGTGKTRLAQTVGFVYGTVGILVIGDTLVHSPKDLIGSYIGTTAPKTAGVLLKGLENVVLIDEAYQIMTCNNGVIEKSGASYGNESVVEIVNFLDKYVGLSIIIVAGYEKEIKGCFLGANEGLARRFLIQWILPNYSAYELFNICIAEIIKKLDKNIFDVLIAKYMYTLINKLYTANSATFVNQAGDAINLSTIFIETYYGSLKYSWDRSLNDKHKIVISAIKKYLAQKGFTLE